jgi:CheY-like chemotaxis protein
VIYGFVKQSGGHVTIYSEEGKGTTVNLYLPRSYGDGAREAVERPQEVAATSTGEIVLLVEDNAEVRSVTARRLGNLGYNVIEADNAAAAIQRLGAGSGIALVFSDVVMPGGMSGFDLARWMREHAPTVPVLLTSGFAEDIARAGETPLPDVEILRKPYSGADLARALRKALERG